MGGTKAAGNYSPVLVTQLAAKKEGYSDVVYLDAKHDQYLEEVSSCNIFAGVFWRGGGVLGGKGGGGGRAAARQLRQAKPLHRCPRARARPRAPAPAPRPRFPQRALYHPRLPPPPPPPFLPPAVKGKTIRTPPLGGSILPGVTRRSVIELARSL